MVNNLHDSYFEIQKSFSEGRISFDKYCQELYSWNNNFSEIIKAQTDNIKKQQSNNNDFSHGGRLVKKKVIDKTGKQVTKWVNPNETEQPEKQKKQSEKSERRKAELEITPEQWKAGLEGASEDSLKNASKYATSEEVRRMARNELLKRSFNLKKHLDMSLMPDFMLDDYIERYDNVNSTLTDKEQDAIHEYRDNAYFRVNKKLREGEPMDEEERGIVQGVERAIGKSKLINDVVLYRGISAKNSLMFINYLKSLQPGDVYEEQSFSSTSLLQGAAQKFTELYSSTNNVTLKIYASKGQNALCMQSLGTEDDKDMYKDEYEFLLSKKAKFQIIESDGNTISVKLLD